jgi:outer membrane protein OmpA-like peptidoglycan-associated protein
MKKSSLLFCCIANIFLFESGLADEVKLYNKPPSAEEISRQLFPDQNESNEAEVPANVKTRSISFGTKKANPVKTGNSHTAKPSQQTGRTGIGLPIQFGYNSADILSESDSYLDQIGIMLKMEKMANAKLLIEGHTDASGSDDHNKILSQARAKAVKNYLISKYDVSPNKLMISGMGESRPIRNKDPKDPLNRRVEFYRAD